MPKNLIDRYEHRPNELQCMCLAEFAATYVTKYQPRDADNDVLPPNETDTESTQITLTNGYGKMNKRRKSAVIRFRTYNKDYDSTNWFRAKLMLYYPWLNETTDLLGGYSTYEEHYNHIKPIIVANEQKYTLADIEVLEVDENNIPEHAWNQIAPNTEAQSRAKSLEHLTEVSQEDIEDNTNLIISTSHGSLHTRFETAANKQEIPPSEYRELMRGLNSKQRQIVMFHRTWCKKAVLALKQEKPIQPYFGFGVGKSHVIKMIHSDTLKLLRLSGTIEPDDITVLLTAPTSVAAFIINGMTIHSASVLGRGKYGVFQPLGHDKLNSLRSKLCKLFY